jgi:glycosyltransferase involved in cell wall biosynthesis
MHEIVRPPIPLVLVKGAYESVGGPETVLQVIAEALDRERFPPLLALLARPGERLPPVLADVAARMPMARLDWKGLAASPLAARRLARLVAQHPGAILHTHDMRANLLAWMIRRAKRVPWIAHVHGWLGATHSGRYRLFEEIDRRLIPGADLVLVGSTQMRDEVLRAGAKRVDIVTNGVPPADPALHAAEAAEIRARVAPSGGLVAGALGRLHPGKGQALLIEALAGLRAQGLDITALIVGVGPAEAEYRALAQHLGVAEHVRFAGLVPDVRPWLGAMDMLCVPSLKDSMPMSAMEAMSMAVPVIASRTGELPVAIQDGQSGLIVEIGSVLSLAAAMERLASSPEERARFGAAGRQRLIERYSPDAMLRQLEGFCATLASEEAARGR